MKISQINICPICRQVLKKNNINPLYNINSQVPLREVGDIFICCSPLANDPLHYYAHVVEKQEPYRIIFQEFSIDLGAKYVIFRNNYEVNKSFINSNRAKELLEIPILLIPDFPDLESLKKKIKLHLTFS
jgi:hypothetical protein